MSELAHATLDVEFIMHLRRAKVTGSLPHVNTWDFRFIPAEEIKVAIHYEYACSSQWIGKLWNAWLSRRVPTVRTFHLADDVYASALDWKKTRSVAVVLSKDFPDGIPQGVLQNEIVNSLLSSAPVSLRFSDFSDIFHAVRAYPTPWQKLDAKSKSRLKYWFERPFAANPPFMVFSSQVEVAACRQSNPDEVFEIGINWGASERDIKRKFEEWLSVAYKQFGAKPKGKQGMASSDKYERLRWLTAWRLDEAGLD